MIQTTPQSACADSSPDKGSLWKWIKGASEGSGAAFSHFTHDYNSRARANLCGLGNGLSFRRNSIAHARQKRKRFASTVHWFLLSNSNPLRWVSGWFFMASHNPSGPAGHLPLHKGGFLHKGRLFAQGEALFCNSSRACRGVRTGTLEQLKRLLFFYALRGILTTPPSGLRPATSPDKGRLKTCSNCDPKVGRLKMTREVVLAGWEDEGSSAGGDAVARPKKLTPKRLREGVEAYFDSISYERPVMERVKTDRKDADGHWIYEEIPVTNRHGKELMITLFTQPPTKGDLYTFLGIHKSTWSRWMDDDAFRPVCEDAHQRIENYWAKELGGKNANGASKMLERAFDWRAEQTIHMTGGIEDYLERLKDAGGGEQEL